MQYASILTILFFSLALSVSSLFSQQTQTGDGTYYSDKYQGKKTASGELYDRNKYTAAHKTLPFGALVQVTNLQNQKAVIVKVNDLGPFTKGRIIDLSYSAAESIGLVRAGVAKVRIDVLEEYPKANSPYAVGPVIGSAPVPAGTGNSTPPAATGNQRVSPTMNTSAPASTSQIDDLVLPNIKPAGSQSTTAPASPASTQRTAEPAAQAKTTPTPASKAKEGLFKFYAQRVEAEGYGVQVGAFSDYSNVMDATTTLSAQGVEDFLVKSTTVDGKAVFKLIVGPFNSRGAADSFQKQLSRIPGMGKGMVISLTSL
ncbi:MAG: septal ring lytic transglycosylase RlpA family protein [Bacteroidia bacterium]